MVKSMSSTSTMDTSDGSSRYTGSASPSSLKSYEKYILEVQSIMQRRLERAASASQPSTTSTIAARALAEQEMETEIVHQLLSKIQQANYSSQWMIHRLQQDLGQSKSEVIECKSKIHQLSKRCTVAEMELKELRIAAARSSNSSGSGSGSGNSSPNKKSYSKRSSTGTSVTRTITDKSFENDDGEEEGCDWGFPKVIGIPSHQESSEFREWMNKYPSNTPSSSSESELLQGVEPIVEQEDGEEENGLDVSSSSQNGLDVSPSSINSTIYSPLVRKFDEQMAALLERRKVGMEFMGGDKVAVKELDEQMAALLKEREIIKSLREATRGKSLREATRGVTLPFDSGSGENETEDVLKEEEDHQPPLNDLGDNSSSATGDVISIDEQCPKDTLQRRLSDYGGALTPIIETSDEPIPTLPHQNNNKDLEQQQQQQQSSPPPAPLCSTILDNSNIGTRYDSRGRCINHPHVQLRKKKKRSLLLSKGSSPSKGNSKEVEWKIKYNCCPDCCIEHLSMLGQVRKSRGNI